MASTDYNTRMKNALSEARSLKQPNLAALAEKYNVKRPTLSLRYHGKTKSRVEAHEQQQLLKAYEEDSLVAWCSKMESMGFPIHYEMLRHMAKQLLEARNLHSSSPKIGANWHFRFLERHPELEARCARPLNEARAAAFNNSEKIKSFYKSLRMLLTKHGIQPQNLWNMDEKGFLVAGKQSRRKVIVNARSASSKREARIRSANTRESVTVVEAISAAGQYIPPFIIWKGSYHLHGWYEKQFGEATFAVQAKGYMDMELALPYMEHFEHYTRPTSDSSGLAPKRLLLMDGFRGHISWQAAQYALDHNIILMNLPAHTTHHMQPLDVGIFSPMQEFYNQAAQDFAALLPSITITKADFLHMLMQARTQALTASNIEHAFEATGIYPVNYRKALPPSPSPSPASEPIATADNKVLKTPSTAAELRSMVKQLASRAVAASTDPEIAMIAQKLNKAIEVNHSLSLLETTWKAQQESAQLFRAKSSRRRVGNAVVYTTEVINRLREKEKAKQAAKSSASSASKGKGKSKAPAREALVAKDMAQDPDMAQDMAQEGIGSEDNEWRDVMEVDN